MGKFDGILIISDIDGTFLGKNSRIVPENIEAIEYFKQNGGMFTFATGRVYYSMKNTIPDVIPCANTYAVLMNGCCLYDFANDRAEVIYCIDHAYAIEAMQYVRDNYAQVGIRIMTPDGFLTDLVTPMIKRDLVNLGVTKMLTVRPITEWNLCGEDWYKLAVRAEAETVEKIRSELMEKYGEKLEYNRSGACSLEMQCKGCTKAHGIEELKAILEKETGKKYTVYACGDFENDIEMLKAADHSVCPANAMDSVKAIAEYKLCHCDEGLIANLIRVIESEL